jgi:RimJ/RimL family protein N-acetyltransferase
MAGTLVGSLGCRALSRVPGRRDNSPIIERWQNDPLIGRAPRAGDLDGYRALLSDPEVARWLWWRNFDEEEVRRWHEADLRHWDEHRFGPWVLVEPEGAMVGRGGLRRGELDGTPVVELVWAVGSGHQGRGYASTAAAAAVRAARELELSDVVALVESANVASCRVAESAGLWLDRELEYDGRPHRLYRLRD